MNRKLKTHHIHFKPQKQTFAVTLENYHGEKITFTANWSELINLSVNLRTAAQYALPKSEN